MKTILHTTGLRGSDTKFIELLSVCSIVKPDIIFLNGDILPQNLSSLYLQSTYFDKLKGYISKLSSYGKVYYQIGNYDLKIFEYELEECLKPFAKNLSNKVEQVDGLYILGCPYKPDSPYALKDWSRMDTPLVDCPIQLSKPIISSDSDFIQISDLKDYLNSVPSIKKEMINLLDQIPSVCHSNAIWFTHSPPAYLNLDHDNVYQLGSNAISELISKYKPLMVNSGLAYRNILYTDKWTMKSGSTVITQPSQIEQLLCYNITYIDNNEVVHQYHPLNRI